MNGELVRMEGQLAIPGIFTETGLNLPDDLDHDGWLEVGTFLARVHQTVAWWVGDWLNFGVAHGYVPRERYDEASTLWSQYTRESLQVFSWVCRSVESSIRIEDLAFGHHQLVAPLPGPEQVEWLELARRHKWSVAQLRKQLKNRHVETPELPDGEFATVVVDPPWQIDTGPGWVETVPSRPLGYAGLTVDEIVDLQPPAAADAHLYLWTINHYVRDAYDIVDAWGFEPSTLIVWCKAPSGAGLGGTFAQTTEYVLFARRGTREALDRVNTCWFQWKRGAHSVKPDDFYDLIETVSPGPYLDMFARRERPGWTVWGNEVAA